MSQEFGLTTREIRDVCDEEISAAGGTLSDTFDDGSRLFLRSTLPPAREVAPRDRMQGGVALLANEQEIRVHPYLYRQVCRNGAIVAQAIQTRQIDLEVFPVPSSAEVIAELREAIRECCSPEAFSRGVDAMRTAKEREADIALQLLPMLSQLPAEYRTRLFAEIMQHFTSSGDRSVFGLVNAVTRTARGISDPEIRWRLEELGGGIPKLLRPYDKPHGSQLEEVVVGQPSSTREISGRKMRAI